MTFKKKHHCVLPLDFYADVPCPTHMLSVGFYLGFSLQLSLHSDFASSLVCLMVQFYSGVKSCIFRIFNVAFSVCSVPFFFFRFAALLGASFKAVCRNSIDHRVNQVCNPLVFDEAKANLPSPIFFFLWTPQHVIWSQVIDFLNKRTCTLTVWAQVCGVPCVDTSRHF